MKYLKFLIFNERREKQKLLNTARDVAKYQTASIRKAFFLLDRLYDASKNKKPANDELMIIVASPIPGIKEVWFDARTMDFVYCEIEEGFDK